VTRSSDSRLPTDPRPERPQPDPISPNRDRIAEIADNEMAEVMAGSNQEPNSPGGSFKSTGASLVGLTGFEPATP
jgi:hypothetical protein